MVFLRSNDVFRVSLELIQRLHWENKLIFVEDIAEIWKRMFWILIGFEILKNKDRYYVKFHEFVTSYISQYSIEHEDEYQTIFSKVLEKIHDRLRNGVPMTKMFDPQSGPIGFVAPIAQPFVAFRTAIATAFERTAQRSAHVLIDNIEEVDFRIDKLPDAAAALLKAVSEFRQSKVRVNATLCIPSEMFHSMLSISSNPSKDFDHNILLQWRSGDLLRIASSRVAKYLYVHEREFLMDELSHIDLSDRPSVRIFFSKIMPGEFSNGLGLHEDPLVYILRHTQLLPRNLLQILTEIFKFNKESGGEVYSISERSILEGTRRAEVLLSSEVFAGYRLLYPHLLSVCDRTLNRLPVVFKYGDLHSAFNVSGKAASGLEEFHDFRRMLVEAGIIGKIVDRTARYNVGLFEYLLPNRLNLTERDELCIHPIFSGIYRAQRAPGGLPIYPYGSDPSDGEFRLSISPAP